MVETLPGTVYLLEEMQKLAGGPLEDAHAPDSGNKHGRFECTAQFLTLLPRLLQAC